jgi:flagellar motor switch protein FliM
LPETEPVSALRRKIRSPANPFDQKGVSPAKAMRLAFARACEEVADFEAIVTGFGEDDVSLSQISGDLKMSDLIVKTKAPSGGVGLAIWDRDAISVFIEQLITGRVVAKVAQDRAPTPTDAAVLAGILDAILAGYDAELAQVAVGQGIAGFRKSGVFGDARSLSMGLSDIPYHRYRLQLEFCNGARNGALHLVFPQGSGARRASGGASLDGWQADWRSALADASTSVTAILSRVSIPLGQLKELEIGSQVPVPTASISRVMLEGFDHRRVALGRLGQSNGRRAVMISCETSPENMVGARQQFTTVAPPTEMAAQSQLDDLKTENSPQIVTVDPAVTEPLSIQMEVAEGQPVNSVHDP